MGAINFRISKTILAILLGFAAVAQGQSQQATGPTFSSFPAAHKFTGVPAKANFKSDPKGKRFKTRLSVGIKAGVNFAGEYTIVRWGCGSPCGMGAILHTQTGRICAWFDSCGEEDFRPDSCLLIIDASASLDPDHPCQTKFLVWNGRKLQELPASDNTK